MRIFEMISENGTPVPIQLKVRSNLDIETESVSYTVDAKPLTHPCFGWMLINGFLFQFVEESHAQSFLDALFPHLQKADFTGYSQEPLYCIDVNITAQMVPVIIQYLPPIMREIFEQLAVNIRVSATPLHLAAIRQLIRMNLVVDSVEFPGMYSVPIPVHASWCELCDQTIDDEGNLITIPLPTAYWNFESPDPLLECTDPVY